MRASLNGAPLSSVFKDFLQMSSRDPSILITAAPSRNSRSGRTAGRHGGKRLFKWTRTGRRQRA